MRMLIRFFIFCAIFFACSVVSSYSQTAAWTTQVSYLSDTSNNQNPTSITTYNGSIYYIYTNPARQMVVGKISPTSIVKLDTVFDLELGLDEKYHICPTIGVDKYGYVHITGDMHNGGWKYFRSNFPENITSWTRRYDLPGTDVTYPTIFYDKSREMYLLFRHRQDSTGSGNHRVGIIKYNADSTTFTMMGGLSYFEKDASTPTTKTMAWAKGYGGNGCWYIKPGHRVYFDSSNRLHFIAAVIDTCLDAFLPTDVYNASLFRGGYESNTHILYAYSDDYGNTWRKAGGALITSLPLTVDNASIALSRKMQHDIVGGECELGAFDKLTPVISYQLYSDNSKHALKWNGTAWVELILPHSTNVFMCRPNGFTAWYNGTYLDYTKDGVNWTTLTGPTGNSFPNGLNGISATGIDREYFKQTGNFRYEASAQSYTSSKIYTIACNVGNGGNIAVSSVSLNNTSLSLIKGTTSNLVATISPANATNKKMIWTSSNAKVAYVNGNGLITTYGCGTAIITVTTLAGGKTTTCTVTVTGMYPVTGVTLNVSTLSMKTGSGSQLLATLNPLNPCNDTLIWMSSNNSVATVNSLGYVTAIKAGTATITVTTKDGTKTATCSITVSNYTNLANNPEFDGGTSGYSWVQNGGTSGTFTVAAGAGLSGANAAKLTITTGSSNANLLKLIQNFSFETSKLYNISVKAKADFDRTIGMYRGASLSPYTAYWTNNITLSATPTVFGPFLVKTLPTELSSQLQFQVANSNKTVYIDSVVINDVSDSRVTSISLSNSSLSLTTGSSLQLSAIVSPAGAMNKKVFWASNNLAVAAVSNTGLVTASIEGTAIITAVTSDGGKIATTVVTVIPQN